MRGNRNEKNLPDDKNDLLSLTTIWCGLGVTALHSTPQIFCGCSILTKFQFQRFNLKL